MREKGEKFHEFSPLKKFPICGRLSFWSKGDDVILLFSELLEGREIRLFLGINKKATLPRLLIRKHEKVSKINVFKGREHGTKSKNLILTGTKGADVKISALFLSPRHRQPPYGVFSYPCLYPPEKCIN